MRSTRLQRGRAAQALRGQPLRRDGGADGDAVRTAVGRRDRRAARAVRPARRGAVAAGHDRGAAAFDRRVARADLRSRLLAVGEAFARRERGGGRGGAAGEEERRSRVKEPRPNEPPIAGDGWSWRACF